MDHPEAAGSPKLTIEWDRTERKKARNRVNQRNYRRRRSELSKQQGSLSVPTNNASRSPSMQGIQQNDTQTDGSEISSQGASAGSPFQYEFLWQSPTRDQHTLLESTATSPIDTRTDDLSLTRLRTSISGLVDSSINTPDQLFQPLDILTSGRFGSQFEPGNVSSQGLDSSWSKSPLLTSTPPVLPQPHQPPSQGKTTLHFAAENGHTRGVQMLLTYGADPSLTDSNGLTPLHVAAHRGHKDVVSVLIEIGCDVNAATITGQTALHLAAENDHFEIISQLLQAGGNPNARTMDQ